MVWGASTVPFSVWRKIAMATWKPRTDPIIWATLDIDAEKLMAYIDDGCGRCCR